VGTKTILNVDGLDWKREKWPNFAKKYIQFAEWLATFLPNAYLTDSHVVQTYYRDRFKSEPPYIPYGSDVDPLPPRETLTQFGLQPQQYILFVGRLVPENNAHHLVQAFRQLNTSLKCVIVGDAPYAAEYQSELKKLAGDDPRIVFTGYLFGKGYRELGANAYIFTGTSGVGGTHPAFVEAMAFGSCVVVNNTPENLETIGDAGLSYIGSDGSTGLASVLTHLLSHPDQVQAYRTKAQQRARDVYSWERVTDAYEQLCLRLANR
jgi:glycosyltransferase involved in cell wall biosynthesis